MNSIFFDARIGDDGRRERLYNGDLFVYSASPSALALCELGLEPQGTRFRFRAFQDLALPLIIARRHGIQYLVGADLGDDFLPCGDETDQLAVDLGETFT